MRVVERRGRASREPPHAVQPRFGFNTGSGYDGSRLYAPRRCYTFRPREFDALAQPNASVGNPSFTLDPHVEHVQALGGWIRSGVGLVGLAAKHRAEENNLRRQRQRAGRTSRQGAGTFRALTWPCTVSTSGITRAKPWCRRWNIAAGYCLGMCQ